MLKIVWRHRLCRLKFVQKMIPWKKVGPQKGDGVYRNREKSSQKYGTKTTKKGLIFNLKNMKINYRHNIFFT